MALPCMVIEGQHNQGKLGCWFFITLPNSDGNGVSKFDLAVVCNLLGDQYIVAQEKHEDGSPHLHAVVVSRIPMAYGEVNEYLSGMLGAQPHVVGVKRPKDCVRYCCKEDMEPLHDGEEIKKYFPWHTKAGAWIRQHPKFVEYDAFVLSQPASLPALRKAHANYWDDKNRNEELSPVNCISYPWPSLPPAVFGAPQSGRIIDDWIRAAFVEGREHKSKQLYVYGEPNLGKTCYFNNRLNMYCAYRPTMDRWWMMNFDSSRHFFIFFDEFDYDVFVCKKDLLKLCAGEPFQYSVKFKPSRLFDFNLPVIFCSNSDPPDNPAFGVRVLVHEVINKLY